jgi:hypothetical protein
MEFAAVGNCHRGVKGFGDDTMNRWLEPCGGRIADAHLMNKEVVGGIARRVFAGGTEDRALHLGRIRTVVFVSEVLIAAIAGAFAGAGVRATHLVASRAGSVLGIQLAEVLARTITFAAEFAPLIISFAADSHHSVEEFASAVGVRTSTAVNLFAHVYIATSTSLLACSCDATVFRFLRGEEQEIRYAVGSLFGMWDSVPHGVPSVPLNPHRRERIEITENENPSVVGRPTRARRRRMPFDFHDHTHVVRVRWIKVRFA